MPLRTVFIFYDRQLCTVDAIVRRILLAFRQKPSFFQLLAFTSGKTTTNPNDYFIQEAEYSSFIFEYQFRTDVEIEDEQRPNSG